MHRQKRLSRNERRADQQKVTPTIFLFTLGLRLRIRFQKDPFWGVHTYRTSIRRPRSHGRGLTPGNVPPPENHGLCVLYMYVDRDGLASSSNRTFPFLSFACQCRSSVLLHVLVSRGRNVRSLRIMEAGDKRKAPKAK